MENQTQNIIAVGRKRFPIEEIALVELFEPPAEQPPPRFTSDKDFKARVVLIDRYNVLTEDAESTAGTPTRHQSRGKASKFASGSSKATNSRRPSEDYLPL